MPKSHGDAPNWVRARARATLLDAFNAMCDIAERDVAEANKLVADKFEFHDNRDGDSHSGHFAVTEKGYSPRRPRAWVSFAYFDDERGQGISASKHIRISGGSDSREEPIFVLRSAWISDELKMELMPEGQPDITLAPWQAVERALSLMFFPPEKEKAADA